MANILHALAVCALSFVAALVAVHPTFAQSSDIRPSAPISAEPFPAWAYPWNPDFVVPAPDDAPQHLPGSSAAVSWKQARDLFFSPDWYPEDHGPMPDVVKSGRKPDVRACASCHRTDGTGGPENASLAGLDPEYFKQQMADFRSGARKYAGPQRAAITLMLATARAATDAEVQAAAEYFAALGPKRNIKVVESDTVAKTYVARLFLARQPDGGTEPLGRRVVEIADDLRQFELRDLTYNSRPMCPPAALREARFWPAPAGPVSPFPVCPVTGRI